MAGSTKLFQRAGSPLIQGRSRYERSFWADWSVACLVGAAGVYAFLAVLTLLDPTRPHVTSFGALLRWLLLPATGLAAMLPASAVGVWLARLLGWRGAWVAGALVGVLAVILLTA